MRAALSFLIVLERVAAIQHSLNATVSRQEEFGGDELRIPLQLVMTAKQGSIDELPPAMRDNIRNTLSLNPELKVRFLNDTDCSDFIASNFGSELHSAYVNEKYGAYRGDICRAAVVALEGGFYADLDMQFRVPFSQMVDSTTTFMSSLSATCVMLNALFAAERGSKVMQYVVEAIKDWYKRNETTGEEDAETMKLPVMDVKGLMGTETMMHALEQVQQEECPDVQVRTRTISQFGVQCGPHQNIRLYREHRFNCKPSYVNSKKHTECTPGRMGTFEGLQYGIFEPDEKTGQGALVAWSRFEACKVWGCAEEPDPRRREARPGDSYLCRDLD